MAYLDGENLIATLVKAHANFSAVNVEQADWDILNDASPAAAAAAWDLISGVPEPSSLCLAALTIGGFAASSRPKRKQSIPR